jgi:HEAT repeat protein
MRTARYAAIAMVWVVGAGTALAQTNSKEIMARGPAELTKLLASPSASTFDKAKACQRLAIVGTKDAVPALAALLPDEKLNVYARSGLEGIADPSADQALRDAAAKLKGRQLIGVIDSIGQRRDEKALKLLNRLFLVESDPAVLSAVAGAVGRIGTTGTADILRDALDRKSPARVAIADGCLTCAEVLVAKGKKESAIALYQAVAKADVPRYLKIAALGGQFRLQRAEAKDLLLAQLRSPDDAFFDLGLAVAREMPGAAITAALAKEAQRLPPERQSLLLLAIGDRKEAAPASLFLAASKSPAAPVREAAIRVLVTHADPSAVAILLDASLGQGDLAQIAKDGLKTLPGRDVDAAVAARLTGADAKAKGVLFELIGARQIVQATPAVAEALTDANEPVRLTALAALAQLVGLENIDLLVDKALAETSSAETTAARAALRTAALRMADRDGCAAKLAQRLQGASNANQTYLLDLLSKIGGPKALAAVVECVKSTDPAIKDAATRALGQWLNAEAAPALLDIAKNDADAKYQIRALRGYIRVARQLEIPWWMNSNAAETKLTMFRTAMEVARRDQEKQLALDILSRIPSATTLDLAVSYLGTPSLKDHAADTAVKIAAMLVADDAKAVAAAMQKVVDADVGGKSANQAKQLLGQVKAAAK